LGPGPGSLPSEDGCLFTLGFFRPQLVGRVNSGGCAFLPCSLLFRAGRGFEAKRLLSFLYSSFQLSIVEFGAVHSPLFPFRLLHPPTNFFFFARRGHSFSVLLVSPRKRFAEYPSLAIVWGARRNWHSAVFLSLESESLPFRSSPAGVTTRCD